MPGTFSDKAINSNSKPEAQFDALVLKNTIVYNGDIKIVTKNLIGTFNILYLDTVSCIVLVSQKIETFNLIQLLLLIPRWSH